MLQCELADLLEEAPVHTAHYFQNLQVGQKAQIVHMFVLPEAEMLQSRCKMRQRSDRTANMKSMFHRNQHDEYEGPHLGIVCHCRPTGYQFRLPSYEEEIVLF